MQTQRPKWAWTNRVQNCSSTDNRNSSILWCYRSLVSVKLHRARVQSIQIQPHSFNKLSVQRISSAFHWSDVTILMGWDLRLVFFCSLVESLVGRFLTNVELAQLWEVFDLSKWPLILKCPNTARSGLLAQLVEYTRCKYMGCVHAWV